MAEIEGISYTYVSLLTMGYHFTDIADLDARIGGHLNGVNIFDLPEGRHRQIVEEFYVVAKNKDSDAYDAKLLYVNNPLPDFNKFLETQGKYRSDCLDAERQAKLVPQRMKNAVQTLREMSFRPRVISNSELNFCFYKGTW